MTNIEAYRWIEQLGVVPVIRASSAKLALLAVEALLTGGIGVVEITLTVPDALGVVQEVVRRFDKAALIGVGTVLSGEQARAAIDAGAQFLVSPGLAVEVLQVGAALAVPIIPGALTPTEIMAARRAGANWIKVFPCAAMGGATYLRALRGPFPDLKLMPTGGVTLANLAEHIAAGAAAVGVGSELVNVEELARGDSASLRDRARAYAAAVRDARAELTAASKTQPLYQGA